MSKATVRHLTGTAVERGMQDLLVALPQLASRSIDQYASLLARSSQLLAGLIPGQLLSTADCCEIPEQDCPPRCVCEIAWEASPGETVKASIRVRNTSAQARNFTFSAAPLQGGGDSPGALTISPAARTLASGESVDVAISLVVNDKFKPSERYGTEVLIRGAYEQCVIVRLDVVASPTVRCEIDQGEVPVRIRAERWYHHFQCTEPCERPRQDVPGITVPGDHP
jgi:hypothetical protein